MEFEEPEIIRQGRNYGVRLSAKGPVIHLIRTDVDAEVSPMIGSEEQGHELVAYLMEKFEDDPKKIWGTDLFGKALQDIVVESVSGKVDRMPENVKAKMQETMARILNEGSGGLICIIPVSYTHLDVYKRQLLEFAQGQFEFVVGFLGYYQIAQESNQIRLVGYAGTYSLTEHPKEGFLCSFQS